MAITSDFLLVHIGEQEILGFLILFGHPRIDVTEIVGERPDIMVVVLRPTREMRAAQLAAGPGDTEGRLVRALALDRVFEGGAKLNMIHKLLHRRAPVA